MTKQKLKYKFNFVDALLILMVIAIIGALYYFTFGSGGSGKEEGVNVAHRVSYVLELEKTDRAFVEKIKAGDVVYDVNTGIQIGTISKIKSVEPAYLLIQDTKTGTITKSVYPLANEGIQEPDENSAEEKIERTALENETYDFYNVKLVVDADMVYTGSSYSIDRFSMYVGKNVNFRLPDFEGNGVCIDFNVLD